MSEGKLFQGREGAERIIDMHVDLIHMLLNLKCSEVGSKIVSNKVAQNVDFEHMKENEPILLWTMPDGTVTGTTESLALHMIDFYQEKVKHCEAFDSIYGTVIELVKYIDKITAQEL